MGIIDGEALEGVVKPMQTHFVGMPDYINASQPILATDEVVWQGMPILLVIATSRAVAEDAADLVHIEYEELPAVADPVRALDPTSPLRLTESDSNLALERTLRCGDVDAVFAGAEYVVSHSFSFGRQAGVPLEPRGILADYKSGSGILTVTQSHQAPNQMREIFAQHLGLDPLKVEVRLPDVGGAFGIKLHAYPDELAVCAASVLLGRPIKFIADRMESFLSDVQAREAEITGRLAVDREGRFLAFDVDVVSGIGAYSTYPRGSVSEGLQAVQLIGAPYAVPAAHGGLRVAHQNKPPSGMYRGVGQPLAVAVTEQLIDLAARALGKDPAELRRLNFSPCEENVAPNHFGLVLRNVSSGACLDKLIELSGYAKLREEQERLRQQGIFRGIGLSSFVELTAVGPAFYGSQEVSVGSQEGCALRLEASGHLVCETSVTDQGQGTLTGIAQVVASTFGVPLDAVKVSSVGSGGSVYGGGAWASRGMAIGGEAAREAALTLRANILQIAAALLQLPAAELAIIDGDIFHSDQARMSVAELATLATYRQHLLPSGLNPQLAVTTHNVPRSAPYMAANGIHACHVEVDVRTGLVRLLGYWVVEDCGRIINPHLVDGQIRGGVVQGIGAALFEHCVYDDAGQLTNGSLADYALPMAGEMPDVRIAHVETTATESGLGAKGAGEAGTIGAIGAVWTAVNDALEPLGATIRRQPFTPDCVLEAILEAQTARGG